jgi:hypothetical protein
MSNETTNKIVTKVHITRDAAAATGPAHRPTNSRPKNPSVMAPKAAPAIPSFRSSSNGKCRTGWTSAG